MNNNTKTDNKTRNWFLRLRQLNIENVSNKEDERIGSCTKTRNNFRRSLKKMHTRVKNAIFHKKTKNLNSIRHNTIHVTTELSSSNIEDQGSMDLQQILEESSSNIENTINTRVPTDEVFSLSNCYWYWGPLTVTQAEEKLKNATDGAFLIRDSSSTSYLFSISFRSIGRTLHSRIEYSRGKYSLYDQEGFPTIAELIENALKISDTGVYCYSKTREYHPNYPVRLTKPISRYTQVPSLKFLCRFVIRQCTNINDIPRLPLPTVLYGYLQEKSYF